MANVIYDFLKRNIFNMIRNRKEMFEYIRADFHVQGMEHPFLARFTYGENWRMFSYMKTLRHLEYYMNTKSTIFGRLMYFYYLLRHRRNCLKYNITIAPNVVGPGLKIVHAGFRRFGAPGMRIGANCTVLPNVLLGKKRPDVDVSGFEIGDNCYFGTGAIVMGPVKIGDNVTVGAGAVVTKDIPDNCVVAGNPARIISQKPII